MKLLLLGALLVLSNGCREDNGIEGFALLTDPDGRGTADTTVVRLFTTEVSFQDTLTVTGFSTFLEVGQFDNIQSRTLLRFKSIPDSIDMNKVTLILDTNTILADGENKSTFRATVHEVTSDWDVSKVTSQNFGDAFDPASLGEAEIASSAAVITGFDTLLTESARFELDQDGVALVNSWADTTASNFGLLVDFEEAAFIKEFFAENGSINQPRLEIIGSKPTGVQDTVFTVADEDAFLAAETSELPPGPLYVDHVFNHQTVLQFDLSEIPRESTINEAVLEIGIDKRFTHVKNSGFTARIDRLASPFEAPASFEIDSAFFPLSAVVFPTTTTVTTVVTNLVQFWVTEDIKNNGMIIRSATPGRDVTRVAFYSSQTNPDQGPRLRVTFSSSPVD